jgi:hypothetical protein
LTELADSLAMSGISNIYQETYKTLAFRITGSNNWESNNWFYKMEEVSEQIYGPFTTQQMIDWIELGYFSAPMNLWIQRDGTDFIRSTNIPKDLANLI